MRRGWYWGALTSLLLRIWPANADGDVRPKGCEAGPVVRNIQTSSASLSWFPRTKLLAQKDHLSFVGFEGDNRRRAWWVELDRNGRRSAIEPVPLGPSGLRSKLDATLVQGRTAMASTFVSERFTSNVEVLMLERGKLIWRRVLGVSESLARDPAIVATAEGLLVVWIEGRYLNQGVQMALLDAASGKPRATTALSDGHRAVMDLMLIATADGALAAYSASDPERQGSAVHLALVSASGRVGIRKRISDVGERDPLALASSASGISLALASPFSASDFVAMSLSPTLEERWRLPVSLPLKPLRELHLVSTGELLLAIWEAGGTHQSDVFMAALDSHGHVSTARSLTDGLGGSFDDVARVDGQTIVFHTSAAAPEDWTTLSDIGCDSAVPTKRPVGPCMLDVRRLQNLPNVGAGSRTLWSLAPARSGEWLLVASMPDIEGSKSVSMLAGAKGLYEENRLEGVQVAHSPALARASSGFAFAWRDIEQNVWVAALDEHGRLVRPPLRANKERVFDFGGPCISSRGEDVLVAWANGAEANSVSVVALRPDGQLAPFARFGVDDAPLRCAFLSDGGDTQLLLVDPSRAGDTNALVVPLSKPKARRALTLSKPEAEHILTTPGTQDGFGLLSGWRYGLDPRMSVVRFDLVGPLGSVGKYSEPLEAPVSTPGFWTFAVRTDVPTPEVAGFDGEALYVRQLCTSTLRDERNLR